ncbi:MAG: RNA polymerase sigma-54 factor, partial [Solibacillus sp.]
FSSKIEMINGTSISQMKVKKLLEKLILEENKSLPFSDQQICNYFNENLDIPISRRTINKYRKELKIPSASKRKFMSS